MEGITIKLPEVTLRRLREEARTTGRSVAALVRERIEGTSRKAQPTVWDLSSHLAGVFEGTGKSATNDRVKFRRRR